LKGAHPQGLRGIGLMLLAVSTFSCLDATSKYLASHYPVPAIVWARYVVQVLLMLVVLGPRLRLGLVRTTNLRLQIVRGLVLTASSLIFLTALSVVPLADAAGIAFMAPLFIAVLAGPVLHERVAAATWLALAGGFVGVLLIIRPGSGLFTWVGLLPLCSALLMAIYQLMTRKLAGRDSALTTLFYPAMVGSILVPIAFPFSLALPHQALHAWLFVALGLLGGVGHFFLIRAHDYAPASVLGPFMYGQLLTALVLGWLVFGELPDGLSMVGMLVVTASGLLLILRHRGGGKK
jgi:drug/metabolite transporter (DMT)-like permease